jgi:hypothetical protein
MRLRRTAALCIIAGALVAGCGPNASTSPPIASLATTTTMSATTTIAAVPSTTTMSPTTTIAVATTMPPTTTTSAMADATTADPTVLAQQLQAVLDRYESLVMRSRSNPELPFTDAELLSELQTVATTDFLGLFWVPKWQQDRDDGTATRSAPSGMSRILVTRVVVGSASKVLATYCFFDNGVTYDYSNGAILDELTYVDRGAIDIVADAGTWKIDGVARSVYQKSSENPCLAEAVVP